MGVRAPLPGGSAVRLTPRGVRAGRRRSSVDGPDEALGLVGHAMAASEQALAELVGSDVGAVTEIAGYLASSGGKRLRPALTALGSLAVGITSPNPRLMCCGELVHLGSLLHDDVVDQGDVRRGRLASHVIHGNAVSVLTGDFCVARALMVAGQEAGGSVMVALASTVAEMSEGEVLQLQRAGRLDGSLDAYYDIIDRKSASLIAWCASAGALTVGNDKAAAALERYGRGVGRAFQITDDVLDYASGTGKTPGADLRERKLTLPLVYAMERVSGLREELLSGPPSAERVAALVHVIRESGALAAALDDAREHMKDALRALDELPQTPAREALRVLGAYLVERNT